MATEQPPAGSSRPTPPPVPHYRPWHAPDWEVADVAAIQALARGEATPEQQVRALTYIVTALCGTYEMEFHPLDDRTTAFAGGRRFVGLQIVKLTKIALSKFKRDTSPTEQG